MIKPGALVLYKVRPAIVSAVSDKIDIDLEGGKSKRVRDKDVLPLHPGPVAGFGSLQSGEASIDEAWELLQGEQATLAELAELLYGDYTPASAWGAWEVLNEGLHFEGSVDALRAREPAQVEADLAAREAKAAEQQAWADFLQRVKAAELQDEDRKRLAEVERVALEINGQSRILRELEIPENAESAYRFLIRCGYWPEHFNPWPRRIGATLDEPGLAVPSLPDEPRRDFMNLPAFAIDDEGSEDPDDAISLDGDRLWVHVADVAALVRPDSHLDQAARERGANLYLPEGIVHMLPRELTQLLGLGLQAQSPALSIGFRYADGLICDVEIAPSLLQVTRMTYAEADKQLGEQPFTGILAITEAYREARLARDAAEIDLPEASVRIVDGEIRIRPLQRLRARQMVTDAMLMAGEAVARYASERQIAIPYAVQPPPEEIRRPQTPAEMYAYRRLFKPSNAALSPGAHFGLGLEFYTRATSPLRRYLDLVTHQQLRRHLAGREPLDSALIGERIGASDAVSGLVRRAERFSNQHWKLAYLARNSDWRGEAVVVGLEERKATVILPELAMETKIRLRDGMALDQVLRLAVSEVDVPAGAAYFRVLG